MPRKPSTVLCLLPPLVVLVLAFPACGGQVQGGVAEPATADAGPTGSAPSSSPTGSPPSSPTSGPPSPPSPPTSTPPSELPPLAPDACALTGDGYADALLQASASSRQLAAYAVVDVKEECSGLGGTHLWLKNVNVGLCGGATLAHLGGHGCMFPAVKLGDTVLAATYADKVSVENAGFCISDTIPANGRVRAFRVLKPGEDFAKLLRQYGCK